MSETAAKPRRKRLVPPGGQIHDGWSWPVDARKIHYAIRGIFLCSSNYGVFPGEEMSDEFDPEDARVSPDVCVTCLRKWQARRAKQEAKS